MSFRFDAGMYTLSDSGIDVPSRNEAIRESGALSENAINRIAMLAGKRGAEPEGLAHRNAGETHHIFAGHERAGVVAHYVCASPYDNLTLLGLAQIPSPDP